MQTKRFADDDECPRDELRNQPDNDMGLVSSLLRALREAGSSREQANSHRAPRLRQVCLVRDSLVMLGVAALRRTTTHRMYWTVIAIASTRA